MFRHRRIGPSGLMPAALEEDIEIHIDSESCGIFANSERISGNAMGWPE